MAGLGPGPRGSVQRRPTRPPARHPQRADELATLIAIRRPPPPPRARRGCAGRGQRKRETRRRTRQLDLPLCQTTAPQLTASGAPERAQLIGARGVAKCSNSGAETRRPHDQRHQRRHRRCRIRSSSISAHGLVATAERNNRQMVVPAPYRPASRLLSHLRLPWARLWLAGWLASGQ